MWFTFHAMEIDDTAEENGTSYEIGVFAYLERTVHEVMCHLNELVAASVIPRREVIACKRLIKTCIEELEGYARICRRGNRVFATDIAVCSRYLKAVYRLLRECLRVRCTNRGAAASTGAGAARGAAGAAGGPSPVVRKLFHGEVLLRYLRQYVSVSGGYAHSIGDNRLHKAAYYGELEAVHAYLDLGDEAAALNGAGGSALHAAVLGGDEVLVAELLSRVEDLDPNVRDANGFSPLLLAVLMEKEAMAWELLQRGADPDAQPTLGYAALHVAVALGNARLVSHLVEHNALLGLEDQAGLTPLFLDGVRDDRMLPVTADEPYSG